MIGFDYRNGELSAWLLGDETTETFQSLVELKERFEKQWNDLPKQNVPPTSQSSELPGGISADDTGDYPEQKEMRLTIAKGDAADFFKRGGKLAAKLERGDVVKTGKDHTLRPPSRTLLYH